MLVHVLALREPHSRLASKLERGQRHQDIGRILHTLGLRLGISADHTYQLGLAVCQSAAVSDGRAHVNRAVLHHQSAK